VEYLYGSDDLDEFDSLAPMMMGYFIFFFVFLIAGISFLRERISGTLDRLLASPIRRSEIVLGYFFGFGLFVTVQTVVIEIFIIYVLGVAMVGNFWTVLAINLVGLGGLSALGTLLFRLPQMHSNC
jgi:ABC-2 type transport system permease protein